MSSLAALRDTAGSGVPTLGLPCCLLLPERHFLTLWCQWWGPRGLQRYLVVLVGGHRDEGSLREHMGAEGCVLGAESVVLISLHNVQPWLVLVHGVENDLEEKGLILSSRSLPWAGFHLLKAQAPGREPRKVLKFPGEAPGPPVPNSAPMVPPSPLCSSSNTWSRDLPP